MAYSDPAFEARRASIIGGKSGGPSVAPLRPTSTFSDPAFEARRTQILQSSPTPAIIQPTPVTVTQPVKQSSLAQQAGNTFSSIGSVFGKAVNSAGNILDTVFKNGSKVINSNQVLKAVTEEMWRQVYPNLTISPSQQLENDIIKKISPQTEKLLNTSVMVQQSIGRGIVQGLARSSLNFVPTVNKWLDTEVKNTPKSLEGARSVGDLVGTVASFISPTGVLAKAKLAKIALPLVFTTLGQTSTPQGATGDQRLSKAIVDATAGTIFKFLQVPANVLSLKNLGLKSAEIATLTGQVYGDIRTLGGSHDDAIKATKDALIFNTVLIGAFSATAAGRFAAAKAFESKIKEGTMEFTPTQARETVINSNLKNTPLGKMIIKASLDADAQGKNLQISSLALKRSAAASLLKAKTPQGLHVGIDLVDPSQRTQQLADQNVPDVIKNEIKTREAGVAPNQAETKVPLTVTSSGGTGLPAESTAVTDPSLTATENRSPSSSYVPGLTADEVLVNPAFIDHYNATIGQEKSLHDVVQKVASGREFTVVKKDIKTAAEKYAAKAQKRPDYPMQRINDLLRSRIIATGEPDKQVVLKELGKHTEIVRATEHNPTSNPWGFSGINVIVKNEHGHFNEVQINTAEEVFVDKKTHILYEKWRREMSIPDHVYEEAQKLAEEARQEYRQKNITKSDQGKSQKQPGEKKVTKPADKKVSYNSKVSKAVQAVFTKDLENIRVSAKTQEQLVKKLNVAANKAIKSASGDKDTLAGIQTSLRKEMYAYAGKTGNRKTDYATFQTLKKDPEIGQYLNALEDKVHEIDVKLGRKDPAYQGGGSGAAKGMFAELENLTQDTSYFKTIEFPELLRLAKEITGKTPGVGNIRGGKSGGKTYGRAYPDTLKVQLDPTIFKDPKLAAKVFSHELGHITDFLPDKETARGNLVGRIATLKKFMRNSFSGVENEKRIDELIVNRKPLRVQRKALKNKDGKIEGKLNKQKDSELLKEIRAINKEIKALQKGAIKNKAVKAELLALSKEWRPFDAQNSDSAFIQYRSSPSELYADAISVLFNDPVRLKQQAPIFWKSFFDNLDRKPKAKENFFATWNLLNKGEEAVFQERQQEVEKMFDNSEQVFTVKELEKNKRQTNLVYTLKLLFNNKNEPLIRKVNEARKRGSLIDSETNPVFAYEGLNYMDGKLENFVEDNYQPIYKKAQEMSTDGWKALGSVLLYERAINERGELANPLGYNPKTAQDQLDGLKKTMKPKDWETLQETVKLFRKATQNVVQMAEDAKFYSPDLLKQMKTNPAYAAFQVIDYLDTFVSAHVYKSIGTLKEIANPATSTVMKGISVMKAIERNNAKKTAVEFFKTSFPDEIQPAKSRFNGKGRSFIEPKDKDLGMVTLVEDGKMTAYYVEKDVAATLNGLSNDTIMKAAKISRLLTGSSIYRPLFTTFNLGFQSFNFVRDFQRYWTNVPDRTFAEAMTSFPRAIYRYGQAVPHAVRKELKKPDAIVKEMKSLGILGSTYNDMFQDKEINPEDKQIERILQRVGLLEKPQRNHVLNRIFDPIRKVLDNVESLGNIIEALPKIAGYNELKGRMSEQELADFIRTKVGSPNFRVKGELTPVTNNIFLFSNAIKEGMKSDYQVATGKAGKQSQGGFWWKTAVSTFLPKMIMAGMLTGLFGKWYQDRMKDASEYDLTNYTMLPIGVDKNGKTVFFRIPQAETQRFMGGLLWKTMRNATRPDLKLEDVFDVASFGAGQLPNLTPSFAGAGAIISYFSGHNPYDAFRNRNVIPDAEYKAGFKYSFPIFRDWLIKNQGAGIVLPSLTDKNPTILEQGLALPVISNIAGRWIKVTNYGQTEANRRLTTSIDQQKSAEQVDNRKTLDDAIKKYNSGSKTDENKKAIRDQLIKDVVGPIKSSEDKTKRTNLIKKYNLGIIRGGSDPLVNSLIDANTNEEKVSLMKAAKSTLGKDYKGFERKMLIEKVITKNVLTKLK